MSVTKGRDRQVPDATAPAIAVVSESASAVEALESLVLEVGFRLSEGGRSMDSEGAAMIAPDVILMDVAQWEVADQVEERLRACRSQWHVPIICLVPLSDRLQPEAVARLSADDYLLKPIRVLELGNRIRIALQRWREMRGAPVIERRHRSRRQEDRREAQSVGVDSACMIDEANKAVILEGRPLNLSPKEYELFHLLYSNAGQVISVDEILGFIWQGVARASASDVHQYMHLLRHKVENDPTQPRWIVTVRGFGYKLVLQTGT